MLGLMLMIYVIGLLYVLFLIFKLCMRMKRYELCVILCSLWKVFLVIDFVWLKYKVFNIICYVWIVKWKYCFYIIYFWYFLKKDNYMVRIRCYLWFNGGGLGFF